MSVLSRRLKVSINRRLYNKDEWGDKLAHGEGWHNYELTPQQLADEIGAGYAFCAQVEDGIRRQTHFVCSDIAAVDIDGGRTVGDALADPFCQKHLTILYLTPGYTVDVQ